jgi:23S rRNA pseudouridine1911/1915/1917 synthase
MTKQTVKAPALILEFLLKEFQLGSATKGRKLIKHGSVKINNRLALRADELLFVGDIVQILKKSFREKNRAPFELLYDDSAILVAVKPAGILSEDRKQSRIKSFYKLVNDFVRKTSQDQERIFLVHRLDLEVSGVMIFAKSIAIKDVLEAGWRANDKVYDAIVEGKVSPKEGRIESWLAENSTLKVYATTPGPNAKQAISHYRVLKTFGTYSLVEVRLETGRKNQIRVHLADLGYPIIGDRKYGARANPFGRIALHARLLSFNHPVTGKRMSLSAEMPKQMAKLLQVK